MPDARTPDHDALSPRDDWQQALSSLPLETPPAGGWERLAPRLHKRRSSARYWVPAALAASLAVLMVLPWKSRQPETTPTPAIATTTQPDASAKPVGAPSKARDLPTREPDRTEAPASEDTRIATTTPKPNTTDDSTARPAKRPQSKKPKPVKSGAEPPPLVNQAPMLAASGNAPATATDSATAQTAPAPTLEALYAESARLEALLSQIRDERVSSGTSMALSAELHDRVTGIDAALSQPDLAADARLNLWRERVATLQRLAGVETTQRWMVANGYRADGQIAQVY